MSRQRRYEEDYDEEEYEECDEEPRISAEDEIILNCRKALAKMEPTDPNYHVYSQALKDAMERRKIDVQTWQAEAEIKQAEVAIDQAKDAKIAMFMPAIVQGVSTLLTTTVSYMMNRKTVNNVLAFEERGNILNTKATSMIDKPVRR